MKQFLACSLLLLVLCWISAGAAGIEFGVFGGLTLPSNEFGKAVFNNEQYISHGSTPAGYHAGAKCKIQVADKMRLFGDISFHKIPKTDNQHAAIKTSRIQTFGVEESFDWFPFSVSQVLVPISVGVEYSIVRFSKIDLFLILGASANYFSNDISLGKTYEFYHEYVEDGFRMGAAGGLGASLGISTSTAIELKAKYNCSNIVVKTPETTRNYFSVSAGLLFRI